MSDEVSLARSFGTAAFDMPAVAAGVAEVLITGIAKLTDIAAGTLLVTEAGGEVYDLKGDMPELDAEFMIFSGKQLKEPLLKAIRSYL
jgi:fructose-1,6-bisphosphatase/inositol monophosphatase family enzyme